MVFKRTLLLALLLLTACVFLTVSQLRAEVEKKDDGKKAEVVEGNVEDLEVEGTVSAVTPQGIAVEYARAGNAAQEVFLPMDPNAKFSKVQRLAELKLNDTVYVHYQRTYRDDKDGQHVVLKTVATQVELLKPAPPEPPESSLVSKEEGGDSGR